MSFVKEFNHIQRQVHATAVDKGFWEDGDDQYVVGTKYALIHSEVTEALDAHRNGDPPDDKIPGFTGQEAELADTIIRIMDLAEMKGLRVAEALAVKAEFNSTRAYKHGKSY